MIFCDTSLGFGLLLSIIFVWFQKRHSSPVKIRQRQEQTLLYRLIFRLLYGTHIHIVLGGTAELEAIKELNDDDDDDDESALGLEGIVLLSITLFWSLISLGSFDETMKVPRMKDGYCLISLFRFGSANQSQKSRRKSTSMKAIL